MKKQYIILLLLAIFSLSLYGCASKTDEEILSEFVNNFALTEDLKNTYVYEDKTITLSLISDNESIVSNEGVVYYTFEEEFVNLNITFSLNQATLSKDFEYVTAANPDKVFEEAFKNLNIPEETKQDITLLNTVKYGKYNMMVTYASKTPDSLSSNGVIEFSNVDKVANLTAKIKYKSYESEKTFDIKIKKVDQYEFESELKKLISSTEVKDNLELPTTLTYLSKEVSLTWESSNTELLDNKGNVNPPSSNTNVSLTVKSSIGYSHTFNLTIMPLDDETSINKALKDIYIPAKLTSDVLLPTKLSYGVTCTWSSSNPGIISNSGKYISKDTSYKQITLTATLRKGSETMTKEYKVTCAHEEHLYIDRTFEGTKVSTHLENGKLVLDDNATSGHYETPEIETKDFIEAVGSYSAISSKNATCELSVSIRVNGKWSKYLSYGKWGLGLQNKTSDTSDSVAKISIDQIFPIGGNADAFKLKIDLRRDSLSFESPVVSLIALTFIFDNYSFPVDISSLPNEVHYDIENLYQGDVPEIGNSICSATSSTMLLKYKGHSFKGLANYEHEYMAWIVRDYGANIFGNWTYNCIAMSAYGEITYVKKMFSLEEIMMHLATVGPISCSVKGTVISNIRTYSTNGHLIVVSGYKIEDGKISLYIDDPNVRSTNVIMTQENFMAVYGKTNYIIE